MRRSRFSAWLLAVFVAAFFGVAYEASAAEEEEAEASPVRVSAVLSPQEKNIGDLLTYEVTATYPRGITVNLPSALTLEPLHVVEIEEAEPRATGELVTKTFTIHFQHFAVGESEVPTFDLTWVGSEGGVRTVAVEAYAFEVSSLLANEVDEERRGEDPPISRSYPADDLERTVLIVAAALLIAAVLAALFIAFGLGRKKVFIPPPIPAHEQAYKALSELESGDLLKNERFEDYYVQLTEIAKGYLQGRFGVSALDRTTEEMRRILERDAEKILPLTPREVMGFLETADLFKFAGFAPRDGEATETLDSVRGMVDRTVPQAKVPKPEQKPAEPPAEDPGEDPAEPGAEVTGAARTESDAPQAKEGDEE